MPIRPPRHKGKKIAKRHQPLGTRPLSSTARGYGYRWQKAREGYLRKHPLCVICEAEGKVTEAREVDHIVPHKGDMEKFWDSSNWQALCTPCHSRKTAKEDSGFGNPVK